MFVGEKFVHTFFVTVCLVQEAYLVVIQSDRRQHLGVFLADVIGGEADAYFVEACMAIWRTKRTTHTATAHLTGAEERVEGQSAGARSGGFGVRGRCQGAGGLANDETLQVHFRLLQTTG